MTREECHKLYSRFRNDPDIFMDMTGFHEYVYSKDKTDAYFNAKQNDRTRILFAVTVGTEVVGELQLKRIDYENKCCTLSIHLVNDGVKNKGYGTAAEKQALAYAFGTLGMELVLADAVLKNKRSIHVLEKVGFTETSRDDMFVYFEYPREKYLKTL